MIQRLTDDGSEVSQPREVDFRYAFTCYSEITSMPFDGPGEKDNTDTSPPFIINKTLRAG